MKKLLLFSALTLLCVTFVTADGLFGFTKGSGKIVSIPNFCGLSEEAVDPPDWLDLQSEYRHDANTKRGTVIAQSPPAGTEQKVSESRRCEVTLVVSLGAETATVPPLSGMDAREAASKLRALGFSVKEETVTEGRRGTVQRTEPESGTTLPTGSSVTLYVFGGADAETVHVPDLSGLTLMQASFELYLAGLKTGEICMEGETDPAKTAVVIRQSPTAGSYVANGTAVGITLTVKEEINEYE